MAIRYECRHCKQTIGMIDDTVIDERQLGFQMLTREERLEMIEYGEDGEMTVKAICESCQEALDRNPLFHQLDSFIQ